MVKQYSKNNREYQMLLDNIPGGVQKCRNDEHFTMIEINRGFLELFGFSRKELSEKFRDHFVDMIHPSDREYVAKEVSAKLAPDEKITLNYRVLCRDGSYKWIMDNVQLIQGDDGQEQVFCVLTDITESRDAREELRLTMERHQIILDQAEDIIFEWDFTDDTMSYSENWKKKFGYDPLYVGMSNKSKVFRNIHPEDVAALQEAMLNLRGGKSFEETEARIINKEGKYIWCRFRATIQYDESHRPLKAVGIISDIDAQKKMIDDLRRRAERDALTGLYNREETERQIRTCLESEPGGLCALFMIDTDNFKQINDTHGHIFGDAVLAELAAGMRKLTRRTDVVGRIGGDEFTIFLKDISSIDAAIQKAEDLTRMFHELFQDDKHKIQVSCSIGAAFYPKDGVDFQSLYQSADLALYQAKKQGKNQYVLYEADSRMLAEKRGGSLLRTTIDSDRRGQELPENLVNYVFQVLYDANDIRNAIQIILEIVGKRFDVSRAYIFENSADGKCASNTFEWCNTGIKPEKDNLQDLPYEMFLTFKEQFKGNSVFYCRDIHTLSPELVEILEPQGISSLLHCAVMDKDEFCGFVGFDECTGLRMWTKEEIGMLSLISQLITTFLLKKRAMEQNQRITLRLNTILDTQDAYIYAIAKKDHKLLYLNHKVRELDPSAQKGMTCYKAFMGKDAPCENCPITDGNGEMYNPRYKIWNKIRVSPMKWGERDAYVLSCFDITEYKRIQDEDTL